MRDLAHLETIQHFMERIGKHAAKKICVYFTGGVSAVLHGWRDSTIDIDLTFVPENDAIFQEIPHIKEELHINIELASPTNFIPQLPGWGDRCVFIKTIGKASFYHYDFYSQALAKIERGHSQDIQDVKQMLKDNLIQKETLTELFSNIESSLYRYPAIDPNSFRKAVNDFIKDNCL